MFGGPVQEQLRVKDKPTVVKTGVVVARVIVGGAIMENPLTIHVVSSLNIIMYMCMVLFTPIQLGSAILLYYTQWNGQQTNF